MPAVLEPPPSAPSSRLRHRRPHFGWRFAITVLRFVIIATVAASLTAGWYLSKKGFGREWRYRIAEELRKHGVEAHIGRLTLDPFRGVVARDVRIFDYKNRPRGAGRENTLARISEISLDINYGALLQHQPFLNALDVRSAQITLPIKSGEGGTGEPVQLQNFRAHVYFPPEQIYVSQAEGTFCGVRISATGQLIKRATYQPSAALSPEEWRKRWAMLQRVASELQKFTFPTARPWLQVKFNGDLEQLEKAHVEATLQGDELRRGDYAIHQLFANAEWADETLTLTRCEWHDDAGSFAAHASWSRHSNEASFQARSNLALKQFLDAFGLGKIVADVTFATPPSLELSGSAVLGGDRPQVKVIGQSAFTNFSYKDIPFQELTTQFSWDGERTLLRDIRLRHQSGDLTAELLDAPNDFRLKIDSQLSPAIMRPLVSAELKEFVGDWEFPRAPTVHIMIHGQDRQPQNWRGEGTIAFGRARFRRVWMNSGSADVRFADGAVAYENIHVTRDEGTGTGSFTYDFKNHEVRIANIKTSLWPAEAIVWVDPKLVKTVVPYKFRQPPSLTTNGVYQFAGGKKTRVEINVDAPGGAEYTFLGKSLPFDRVNSRLLFTDDRLQIVDLKGTIFSGTLRGSADISLAKGDSRYQAKIGLTGIDFPKLTDLYWNYKSAQGVLNGSYDFTGRGGEARTMQGRGKLEVTDGDVFAIPVFGPLSGIMHAIIPHTGYSIAHNATASFTIKDGVIHTEDFDASGRLFRLLGHGDIHFLDDKLNFEVRIGGKGPTLLLTPVYKVFEYVGEGSLKHPDWHAKRF